MSRFKLDKNEKNGGDYLGGSKGDEIHGENPPIWRAIDRATGGNGLFFELGEWKWWG